MGNDNDTIIIGYPVQSETRRRDIKPRAKPKEPKIETGIIKNIRMDIGELNELRESELRKDTRSDIFMGQEIDKSQKSSIHDEGKVYVRGHTKIVNKRIIVVKPHLRDK